MVGISNDKNYVGERNSLHLSGSSCGLTAWQLNKGIPCPRFPKAIHDWHEVLSARLSHLLSLPQPRQQEAWDWRGNYLVELDTFIIGFITFSPVLIVELTCYMSFLYYLTIITTYQVQSDTSKFLKNS